MAIDQDNCDDALKDMLDCIKKHFPLDLYLLNKDI